MSPGPFIPSAALFGITDTLRSALPGGHSCGLGRQRVDSVL